MKEKLSSSSLPYPIHHPTPTIITTILSCSSILFSPSLGSPTAVTRGAFSLSAVIAVSAQRRKRPQVPKHPKPQRQIKPTRGSLIQCCFIDPLIVSQKLTQISMDQPPSFLFFTICLGGGGGAFNEMHIKAKHIRWLQNLHQNCGGTHIQKRSDEVQCASSCQPFLTTSPSPQNRLLQCHGSNGMVPSQAMEAHLHDQRQFQSRCWSIHQSSVVRCGWVLLGFQYL